MSIEDKFLKATIHVRNLPKEGDVSVTQQLQMYGLYKRATVGKCSDLGGLQPWTIQFEARAKWDAWNAVEDLSVVEAMEKYTKLVTELCKDYE